VGTIPLEPEPDPSLAAHERAVLDVVRAVTDPLVAAGAATLDVEISDHQGAASPPSAFKVRPTAPDACPIIVQVDHVRQLSLFMGGPTWSETWHADREDYLRWVREAVEAVVDGRYEEWVHADGRRAKGIFHLRDGPEPFYNNVIRTWAVGGPRWRHHRYAPYRAEAPAESRLAK
jgi:hypothetical protein